MGISIGRKKLCNCLLFAKRLFVLLFKNKVLLAERLQYLNNTLTDISRAGVIDEVLHQPQGEGAQHILRYDLPEVPHDHERAQDR